MLARTRLREPVCAAFATALLLLSNSCAKPHSSVDATTELWADASNRENQLKRLVVRYQEATKRIEEYQAESNRVEEALRLKKEELAKARAEAATAKVEFEAAVAERDQARAAAAAALQHAAESRKATEAAEAELLEIGRRHEELAARISERTREIEALEQSETDLKKKLADTVDRAVVLKESAGDAASRRVVRLTFNTVRRDGLVSVLAKGSDRLVVGDRADVRRFGELIGRVVLTEVMVAAPEDSDRPAVFAARFEAEREGAAPALTDEITAVPKPR